MKRSVIAVLGVAAGYAGYVGFEHWELTEARKTYAQLATALAFDRFDEARELTTGSARAFVESAARRAAAAEADEHRRSKRTGLPRAALRVTGAEQEIASSRKGANGRTVWLRAIARIHQEIPSCTGMDCTQNIRFVHEVEICREGDRWTVCSLHEARSE